jgi:oxygen-dependent protoporphyrinogen oxidase
MTADASLPIVIVGGGVAGLSAGYELACQSAPFVLLEQSATVGGVIVTDHVDGFTIDGGPDSLLVQKPAAVDLCRELGLGDRLFATRQPRTAFIYRAGRLHPLPEASVLGIPTRFAPLAMTRLFSLAGKVRMAGELFVPRRTDGQDESIGGFMARRFGREVVDYLAEPLLAGIHAGDVDMLSMRAAFPRLTTIEATRGSLIRAFRQMPSRTSPDGLFRSLPGGIRELVEALVAALPADSLRTNTRVTAIGARSANGSAPCAVQLDGGETVAARAVILAVPAWAAADLLSSVDGELAAHCRSVPYASTCTVALAYPRAHVRHALQGSGFVVPRVERDLRIMAASWVSSKWPGRAPESHVLLRAFIGGMRSPSLVDLDDEQLATLAHGDLSGLLGIEGAPSLVRVYRWPRANAQHIVGHLARVAAIEDRLARCPGVYVTGSGFRGTGIPDCIEDARTTARQVLTAASGARP